MSKPYRTMEDYRALRVEAQRLVRAGVGINETGRRLEVAQGTIVRWASEDGFRHKDLEAERLTGKRAPPPAFLERAKYRRSGEMQWPMEYASRMAIAAEQQAEAAMAHVALLSKPGGPLAAELDPAAAAARAMVDADTLRGEGMFVTAERSVRIAERLLRAQVRLRLARDVEAGAVETPVAAGTPGDGAPDDGAPAPVIDPVAAAQGSLQRAAELASAGSFAAAEQAGKMAERFLRLAELMSEAPEAKGPDGWVRLSEYTEAMKLSRLTVEKIVVMRIELDRARREGRKADVDGAMRAYREMEERDEAERAARRTGEAPPGG
jgi:hypothetical protein